MLTLNAGHKPVKTRHDFELLFLNLLPILRSGESKNFKLLREKDIGATQPSKTRTAGSFHFAHVLTALLSLYEGKPVAPSTGLIQSIQTSEAGIEEYSELTSAEFLRAFVTYLVRLDQLLEKQYGELGVLWMGREVSLAGLFGAVGIVAMRTSDPRTVVISRLYEILKGRPRALALEQFELQRNSLDLSKVNIGNANRRRSRSYSGATSPKPPTKVDWRKHFGAEAK